MQTLYTHSSSENTITTEQAIRELDKRLDQSVLLFLSLVYTIAETCRYAETDARNRASKHLPTADDLQVNTKIAGNQLYWRIMELPSYQKACKELKPENYITAEWIRKIYNQLTETDLYRQYIRTQERDKKQEKDIIEFIFTDLILPNESFIAFLEDQFTNWDDDSEMMRLLMLNFLNKPNTYNFQQFISADKLKYGEDLLQTAIEKQEICDAMIKPKLINWDPERTALLDMIMIRLGICEFIYFETIPPKVTINEYIDLAKEYSTPQSGHFVNGILDSIHKDLVRDQKLNKVEFKKANLKG
jgi:N utilization substance protein B